MSIVKLLSVSSQPIGLPVLLTDVIDVLVSFPGTKELGEMLEEKNGFFAFEKALHVFYLGEAGEGYSLEIWNDFNAWKSAYSLDLWDILFFAEDIFGNQYGIRAEEIIRFDPEDGSIEHCADSLAGWAEVILNDYNFETGYPLAHTWQSLNGPLSSTERLIPKLFFCLGGEYTVENLYNLDAIQGMRLRGDLYNQIKSIPDGSRVTVRVKDS